MRALRRTRGFTLIELMIVVAIVGVLAAAAIPNFRRFQLRTKGSEAKVNIAAIRTAEMAAVSEFGDFIAAATSPATYGGATAIPFTDAGPSGANFATLGFQPEGVVYFNYSVSVTSGAFTAEASADIDGDGTPQIWGFVLPDLNGATAAPVLGCPGVYDSATGMADLTNTVGPCGATFGLSEF